MRLGPRERAARDELIARACDLRRRGYTYKAIAEACDRSLPWVAQVTRGTDKGGRVVPVEGHAPPKAPERKGFGPPPTATPTEPEPNPAPSGARPTALSATASTIDIVRTRQADLVQMAIRAQDEGNTREAARLMRDAGEQLILLARLEKEQRASTALIGVTPEEYAKIEQALADRMALLETVPITCAECGRKLRAAKVGRPL